MKYKPRNYVVSQIKEDYEKKKGQFDRLVFDYSTQRPEGLWASKDQSLLIHSILQGYAIPLIYLVQNGADSFEPIRVLDGKQRLTITYNFITNGFKLSKMTPPVRVKVAEVDEFGENIKNENGITKTKTVLVEVKNKKFSQLPEEFQKRILNFEFASNVITEAEKEELDELIFRLNNGKATSAIHKAVMMGGSDVAEAIRHKILENNFFDNRFAMSPSQEKNSEDMKCVFHTLALLTNADFNKLTSGDLTKIAENMKKDWEAGKLTEQNIEYCNLLLENLNMWLPDEYEFEGKKVLTSIHIPIMVMNVEKAIQMMDDGELTEEQYKDFLRYWVTSGFYANEYTKFSEGSPSDRKNIESRIDFMESELYRFVGINVDISLENAENLEDDEVPLYEVPVELRLFATEVADRLSVNTNIPLQMFILTNKDCPYNAMDNATIENTIEWYLKYGNPDMLDKCLSLACDIEDYKHLVKERNIPFLVYAYDVFCTYDIKADFSEWLDFFGDGFDEIDNDEKYVPLANSTVNVKQSIIRQSIYRFATENENKQKENCTNDETI